MSFCILVGIRCHNIPNCTPHNGYHGATKVTKVTTNADIAKTTQNCTNYKSARPTPLHTTPMQSGPETIFSGKIKKHQKSFDPPKRGGVDF